MKVIALDFVLGNSIQGKTTAQVLEFSPQDNLGTPVGTLSPVGIATLVDAPVLNTIKVYASAKSLSHIFIDFAFKGSASRQGLALDFVLGSGDYYVSSGSELIAGVGSQIAFGTPSLKNL